jgi:hypothetical protein
MTASSSTSAPVKGRLDVSLPLVDEPETPLPVLGSAEVAAAVPGVVELPATVGTTTGQVGDGPPPDGVTVAAVVVGQFVAAAPASPGTTTTDATAIPAPKTKRRAQIMICLPSTGTPACPSYRIEQPLAETILPAAVWPSQRPSAVIPMLDITPWPAAHKAW